MLLKLLPFSPQLIQARWLLEMLPSDEAILAAQEALETGYDGPNVRRLAGLVLPNRFELEALMPEFLADMGIKGKLSKQEAGWALGCIIANSITEGRIRPYEGARFIWREIINEVWPNNAPEPLLKFLGGASEYEDCECYSNDLSETRRQIEQQIVKDSHALIADSNCS
jgi:hypothetical protein